MRQMGLRSQPFTTISIAVALMLAYLWVAATFGLPFGKSAFWLLAPTTWWGYTSFALFYLGILFVLYRSYLVSESGHDGRRQRLEVAAYETPKFPAIFLLRLTNQSAHEIEKRRFLPTSKQLYNLDAEDYDAG
ncbi:hypothetical protein E6H30_02675 [Candidatus Bathyarchaeota archaeon]|nr:MAG: hypothetical protein E6H30_02675 [Candidatus Bathyarchaeota archaeon]